MNKVQTMSNEVVQVNQCKWLQLKVGFSRIRVRARKVIRSIRAWLNLLGEKWREEALRAAEIERAMTREKVRLHERHPFRWYGH
jgi:hypothetical protein